LPPEGQGAVGVIADAGETQVIVKRALRIRIGGCVLQAKRNASLYVQRVDAIGELQ
jgi:hypothetical protein